MVNELVRADKFQENMLNNGQDIQFMRIIT